MKRGDPGWFGRRVYRGVRRGLLGGRSVPLIEVDDFVRDPLDVGGVPRRIDQGLDVRAIEKVGPHQRTNVLGHGAGVVRGIAEDVARGGFSRGGGVALDVFELVVLEVLD